MGAGGRCRAGQQKKRKGGSGTHSLEREEERHAVRWAADTGAGSKRGVGQVSYEKRRVAVLVSHTKK